MSNLHLHTEMNRIKEIENRIAEEFALFGHDWEMKYEHIIEKGKKLSGLKDEDKKDVWLVKGCQSKVWLIPEKRGNQFYFYADSDAIITKGIVSIILEILNGSEAEEILSFDGSIFEKIGLLQHLSPTRANGLVSMINTIKNYVQSVKNQ